MIAIFVAIPFDQAVGNRDHWLPKTALFGPFCAAHLKREAKSEIGGLDTLAVNASLDRAAKPF